MKILMTLMFAFSLSAFADVKLGQDASSEAKFCDQVDQTCDACMKKCIMRTDAERVHKNVSNSPKKSLSKKAGATAQ